MGSDPLQRPRRILPQEGLNVYALVIYIPEPLGKLLDDLRLKLVPACNPHAHVSLLPPRPLAVEWRVASDQVRTLMDSWTPFEVELAGIGIFPETDVIYIEVGAGAAELRRMHAAMNSGTLEFQDPFPYHPHVTLAQELPSENVLATNEQARRLWQEFSGSRRFLVEHAVFVKNSLNNCWIDLAEYSLGGSPARF